jgi:hypothetical protein
MPRQTLKHYDLYLKKIRLYCQTVRTKIEFCNVDGDGAWVPARRLIRVDPELTEPHIIAVLLHELGHLLDDTLMTKAKFREIDKAYGKLYSTRPAPNRKKTIYRTEVRAWEYGRVVAKILGIRLGLWYNNVRADCLKGYKK